MFKLTHREYFVCSYQDRPMDSVKNIFLPPKSGFPNF